MYFAPNQGINFGIKEYQEFVNREPAQSFKGNSTLQIQEKPIKYQKSSTITQSQYHNKEMDKKETI